MKLAPFSEILQTRVPTLENLRLTHRGRRFSNEVVAENNKDAPRLINWTQLFNACEKVFGQIGIAFHSPAKPIVFDRLQGKFVAEQIFSCLHSVAKHVSKNEKLHIIIVQLTIDNSVI